VEEEEEDEEEWKEDNIRMMYGARGQRAPP